MKSTRLRWLQIQQTCSKAWKCNLPFFWDFSGMQVGEGPRDWTHSTDHRGTHVMGGLLEMSTQWISAVRRLHQITGIDSRFTLRSWQLMNYLLFMLQTLEAHDCLNVIDTVFFKTWSWLHLSRVATGSACGRCNSSAMRAGSWSRLLLVDIKYALRRWFIHLSFMKINCSIWLH